MAELNMLERIGNWFDASLSQQKFINQMRDEQNRYNDHYRNKELADLEKQQDAAITAAKQQYAGDKEALKNALNKIDGEFKAKKADVETKYPKWSSTDNDVAKAKSWQSRKNALEKSTFESDDKAKMEEVFGKPGESSDTGDQGASTDSTSTSTTSTSTSTAGEKPDSSYISNNVMSDIANTMYGMDPSGRSDQLRKQAQMHDVQAADEQKNSQRNMQVANRDARAEADKDAVAQAASKNAQTVNNLSSATGAGAAALNRTVETGDPNTHRQRSDQQHAEGVKNQREMWGARQTAEEERGSANITDYQYRQAKGQTALSDHLSQPVSGDTASTTTTTNKKYTRYEKEETEDDGEETKPQATATAVGQQALNYVLGYLESNKGIAVTEEEKKLAESVLAKYPGIQRVRPGTFQNRNLDPELAEGTFISEDQFGGTPEQRKALMDELRVLRSPEDPAKNTSEADAYDASAYHAVDSNTGALIDQTSLNSALTNPLRR